MKNYRNGEYDVGPSETPRTHLPPTWSALRFGEHRFIIAYGPSMFIQYVPQETK